MFFLYPGSKSDTPIILHIRGTIDEKGNPGFVKGERIYLVRHKSSTDLEVIKQVGTVQIIDGKLSFHYTDSDFKKVINYKENTGHSIMDGANWEIHPINYLNKDMPNQLFPNKGSSIFMYSGAKKPFDDVGSVIRELVKKSFFNEGLSQKNQSENDLAEPAYGPLRDGYR